MNFFKNGSEKSFSKLIRHTAKENNGKSRQKESKTEGNGKRMKKRRIL